MAHNARQSCEGLAVQWPVYSISLNLNETTRQRWQCTGRNISWGISYNQEAVRGFSHLLVRSNSTHCQGALCLRLGSIDHASILVLMTNEFLVSGRGVNGTYTVGRASGQRVWNCKATVLGCGDCGFRPPRHLALRTKNPWGPFFHFGLFKTIQNGPSVTRPLSLMAIPESPPSNRALMSWSLPCRTLLSAGPSHSKWLFPAGKSSCQSPSGAAGVCRKTMSSRKAKCYWCLSSA